MSDAAHGAVPLITLREVSRTFDVGGAPVHALHGVTLDIHHGEQVAIVGASGSGKSTLLGILGLLERPSAGTFRFDGTDAESLSPDRRALVRGRAIGFVFQQFHLVPHLSARQNVELPLHYQQVPRAERAERVSQCLDSVGLLQRSAHRPGELSGGERQRVAIARAIVARPLLLLADEPTGALDSANGRAVMRLMEDLAAQAATTLVVITHDAALAKGLARSVHLSDGRVTGDHRRDE
jgi:ABC-type lipoprotein export system ATPase subunit